MKNASVAELALDWLAAKRVAAGADDPGNSDRARRSDLRTWGRAISMVAGRDDGEGQRELEEALAPVTLADFNPETLLHALDVIRADRKASSANRALSTLRGFCKWLVRRGYLDDDPTADELLSVSSAKRGAALVKAFTAEEVEALARQAGLEVPSPSAWPPRDEAVVRLMAGAGLRVSETCALEVGDVDRSGERPILRVSRGTKGGKLREVPVPAAAMASVDAWFDERRAAAVAAGDATLSRRLSVQPPSPVFVRHDGRPLNQQFVDRLLRRIALESGVGMPGDAAAHALRHHYGVQLALRGVPLPIIQQLMGHSDPRTTTIYTRMAARNLTAALEDAGWL